MKLFFDVQIADEYGNVHGRIRREVPRECAFIGWRPVEELKMGVAGGMDYAVNLMRTRQFRKELLTREASRMGALLAEHLEDREGWHDQSRQQTIEAQYPKTAF